MSGDVPPVVLVVDDDPEPQRAAFRDSGVAAHFEVVHPDEVDDDLLRAADLVLVDLRLENWPARDNARELWGQPVNGLALAAVLREHANRLGRTVGFALRSGHLADISVSPAEPRAHAVARAHNLEWVFSKVPGVSPDPTPGQAATLAAAVGALPGEWSPNDRAETEARVVRLLGIPGDSVWRSTALKDVENCRPPLTELSAKNHGLLFLRWLLQRILPYPCFLLDSHRLAARLRTSHASLLEALLGPLGERLGRVKYSGIGAGFLGDRWWRAAVEDLLWELTGGVSVPAAALRSKLSDLAGIELLPSVTENPIVCVDENYVALSEAASAADVVRIQPDDWPVFASQAWTTVELAKRHARLRANVASEDWERVAVPDEADGREGGRE